MKRFLTLFVLTLAIASLCMGGTVTGYISDEGCARNGEARNPACAKNCISGGATAVLVTDAGEIYTVADQSKITKLAGEVVAVTGKIEGKEIKTVESAVVCSESDLCKG